MPYKGYSESGVEKKQGFSVELIGGPFDGDKRTITHPKIGTTLYFSFNNRYTATYKFKVKNRKFFAYYDGGYKTK